MASNESIGSNMFALCSGTSMNSGSPDSSLYAGIIDDELTEAMVCFMAYVCHATYPLLRTRPVVPISLNNFRECIKGGTEIDLTLAFAIVF